MTASAEKMPWPLTLKVAALVTLIGPPAGSLILGVLAFAEEAFETLNGNGSGHLAVMPFGLPWLVLTGYVFGTLPALIGGLALALYMRVTGREPWIAGLALGTLAPPLCLAAIGATSLPQSGIDMNWLRDTGKVVLFSGGLGFGSALLTALVIRRLLRRSIAQHAA